MLPILLKIGSFQLSTFAVVTLLAFLVSSFVFWRKTREEHYAEDEAFDGWLLALLWGALWARVGFIVFHWDVFGTNFGHWLDIFAYPGFTPLFGIVAFLMFLYRFAAQNNWDVFEFLDFGVLSLVIGSVIVWIGAFLDGSSFGNPTSLPWGVQFPAVFDMRHPVQIYAAFLYLALFLYLAWVEQRYRTFSWYRDKKHSAQSGFLVCIFLMAYGVVGILLALLSPPSLTIMEMSIDLPVKIAFLVYGFALLYIRSGRSFLPKR